jgi:xanthine dehydrogenase YagR molybdenum-binding subunit
MNEMVRRPYVGSAQRRVDGALKVTGGATYAAEFSTDDLAYGYVVSSAVTKGKITTIDTATALAVPGVIDVLTHENRPPAPFERESFQDAVAPPGVPFRPLESGQIVYGGQPVALVVAETFEAARYAASLVVITYDSEAPVTDLAAACRDAYDPPEKRTGIAPPPKPWGDAEKALAAAPIRIEQDYRIAIEHHQPMEMFASTVIWHGEGVLTIHDKIQGVTNSKDYVVENFGLNANDIRVVSPFIGGAFGSGLRPQYQLFLAVLAALKLKRSVRVVLTRDQMFTFSYRPEVLQHVALGADGDGNLLAMRHDAIGATSTFEDYQEVVVNWTGLLYSCDNVALTYKLAKLDTYSPADMRAPGAFTGVLALEIAMDELADAAGIDPIELRLRNYTETDETEEKPYTSKELRACYRQGAEKFGWSRRTPAPRSMRDGRDLIGLGMASGMWEAMMMETSARAVLTSDGKLEVANAAADIGTGTYTILAQIAADTLGLNMADVTVKLSDTDLPFAPVEGGSWTAASSGNAVRNACLKICRDVFMLARGIDNSPLANADFDHVVFSDGYVRLKAEPDRHVRIRDVMRAAGRDSIAIEDKHTPDPGLAKRFSAYTHSAVFAEVRVDEELGVVRLKRLTLAIAAGKILNLKTARSQIIGGAVMGIGAALHEESMLDHRLGRLMNHNFGEYHIPVNADVHDIDVIFVEEDDKANALGVKGLGEIGIVGTAAAIANAIFHATGKRMRDLPITIDKIIAD